MRQLVTAMRRDLGNPRLPFVTVQIASVVGAGDARWWNMIQEEQRRLPEHIPNSLVVPAIDLELEDVIHLNGSSQNRLGVRLAQAMCVLRREAGAGRPPITLKSFRTEKDRVSGSLNVLVRFSNVIGRLQSDGKPAGFDLVCADSPGPLIYRTDLRRDTTILKTVITAGDPRFLSIHYGHGSMPYCNIVDSADRSLPVFGPIPLFRTEASSGFVKKLLVGRLIPADVKLEALPYPGDRESLGLAVREFVQDFCSLHEELAARAPENLVVHFACTLDCPEPMQLELRLGYDGPVRMWIDSQLRYYDPAGANPAVADAAKVPFTAAVGKHEVIVALSSNRGQAWGIFLRVIRKNVTARQLRLGPPAYRMPEILAG
jgi:hypothetical protein